MCSILPWILTLATKNYNIDGEKTYFCAFILLPLMLQLLLLSLMLSSLLLLLPLFWLLLLSLLLVLLLLVSLLLSLPVDAVVANFVVVTTVCCYYCWCCYELYLLSLLLFILIVALWTLCRTLVYALICIFTYWYSISMLFLLYLLQFCTFYFICYSKNMFLFRVTRNALVEHVPLIEYFYLFENVDNFPELMHN